MTCKNYRKKLSSNTPVCPNNSSNLLNLNFKNNRLGENGKNAEYVTEKYNLKKKIYEPRAKELNKQYKKIIIIFAIILIIAVIAIVSYLV